MNPFMEAAIVEARAAVERTEGGPFGAVVVQGNRIVGRGHNTVVAAHDPTAHAEINAIRDASAFLGRFELSDCELYTTCEPCPMCYAAIYWARITVIYRGATKEDAAAVGFDDQAAYEDIARPASEREIAQIEVDREACLEPFHYWQSNPDRVPY